HPDASCSVSINYTYANILSGTLFYVQSYVIVGYYIYEVCGRTINNAGTFRRSAGSGLASIDATFYNTGTTEVQTGTLRVTAGGTNSSVFTLAAGTVFSFQSNYLLDNTSSISGAGVASIDGVTVTVNGVVT